jgi:hypothetical protein
MAEWIDVCALDDIEEEDVVRFDHDGRTFAVYAILEGDVLHRRALHARTGAPRRRARDGRHDRMPQAQWSVQLPDW